MKRILSTISKSLAAALSLLLMSALISGCADKTDVTSRPNETLEIPAANETRETPEAGETSEAYETGYYPFREEKFPTIRVRYLGHSAELSDEDRSAVAELLAGVCLDRAPVDCDMPDGGVPAAFDLFYGGGEYGVDGEYGYYFTSFALCPARVYTTTTGDHRDISVYCVDSLCFPASDDKLNERIESLWSELCGKYLPEQANRFGEGTEEQS